MKTKSIIVEVLSIVLGVLLALGVNEWNEDRIHAREAKEALTSIQSELARNQKILNKVHENNTGIINAMAQENSEGDGQFVPGLQIQDTAWQAMLATGLTEHIDYKLLSSLSAAYSFQEVYRSLSYQMIQNVMTTSALAAVINKDADIPDNLFLDNMELIVLTEGGLKAHYERALETLAQAGYSGAGDSS